MFARHNNSFVLVALLLAIACYFAYTVSADNPSAGKTKKAVEAADAATKKAKAAVDAASAAVYADVFGTQYPDTADGKAAKDADKDANDADAAAEDAEKAAAEARDKACRSGTAEDKKAADDAEKAAKNAEAVADAADAAADTADRKADPYGKQLQKKARDAARAARAAKKAARAAICFALQCAQLMDESSEQNKKKKQETIETIEGLDSTVDQLALAPQQGHGEVKTANGLRRVTFDTKNGQVTVNLPDDMRAGDTISGTVIAEPKGQNETERTKNMAELSGLVIEISPPKNPDGTRDANIKATVSAANVPIKINLPPAPPRTDVSSSGSGGLGIKLTNTTGSFTVGGPTTVPIELVHLSLQSVAPIQVPTIGQQGRPIEIIGPFDGNASNTTVMFGPARSTVQDFEKNTENVSGGFGLLQPLAESPRKCVLQAPANVTGPIELYVKDGPTQTTSPYRNVSVNLSASKINLQKGEQAELHVEVNGLQGNNKSVPMTLQANGPITVERGMDQELVIQPSEVSADGRYTTTRGIEGVQTGAWEATLTVVTLPPLILLRDPSPPRYLLINSQNGHYDFCGGPGGKFSGNGQVKADGCQFYFFQDSNEKLLMGVLNACGSNNNRYWYFTGGVQALTVDLRVTVDNANPPKTRVYFNPLNRPFPPVQDVSAFATCP
jgi:hypothetical protein